MSFPASHCHQGLKTAPPTRASQPQKMFDGKVPGHEIIIRLPNHFNAYSIVSTDFRRCHWKRFFEDSRAKDSADASPLAMPLVWTAT
jgi:hypothetical protein